MTAEATEPKAGGYLALGKPQAAADFAPKSHCSGCY